MMSIDKTTEDFFAHFHDYWKLAYARRGEIINRTIDLEREMDKQIANYFCETVEKRDELLVVLLNTNKMDFESKLQVLRYIIEKDGLEFRKMHPNYFKDLEKIMKDRNQLAHATLDFSNRHLKVQNLTITLLSTKKNKVEKIEYTEKAITDLIALINKYQIAFMHWHPIT